MQSSHFASQASISFWQCFECSSKALNVIQNAWQQPTVVSVRYFVQHFNLVKLDKSFLSPMLHHWITVYLCFLFFIFHQVCRRAYPAYWGGHWNTRFQLCYKWTQERVSHGESCCTEITNHSWHNSQKYYKMWIPFVFLTSLTCNKSLS